MNVSKINRHEASFFTEKKDALGKVFSLADKSIPILNSDEIMEYVQCKREPNDSSFYYEEKFDKTQIVIHFTAGYLKGDIATLTTPNNHVSTPFIIGRNGKILNMWPSSYWSYHLGSGAVGGNTKGCKKTIAIEMSNIGYLKKVGNNLASVYSDTDVYCSLDETDFYTKLETPFRGQEYYATFTEEQYESLIVLLRYLTNQYNIPRDFLEIEKRYETGTIEDIPNFKGIVSHINYRNSGKWDFGPAFDWDKLITGVTK